MQKANIEKVVLYTGLAVLLIIVVIIRLNFLDFPFERDEGLYAYFASLLLEGQLPYEAFYDPKPPGLFYTYAFIMAIFGKTDIGLHTGFLLINTVTIVFLFLASKKLWNSIAALFSSASFAILSLGPHVGGLSVLSEHLVVFWLCLALYLLIKATQDKLPKLVYLSAIAFGLSFFVKQNGAFFIVAAGLYLIYYLKWVDKKSWAFTIKQAFVFGILTLFPTLLLVTYLTANGLGKEFFYWVFQYPAHLQDVPLSQGWILLKASMPNILQGYWIWWILAILGVFSFMPSKNKVTKVLIGIFTFFSFLSILPRLTFHGHYFLFLFPAFSLLIGFFFNEILVLANRKFNSSTSSSIITIVLVLLMGLHLANERSIYFHPDYKNIMKEVYGSNPFIESKLIAAQIKELANEGDQMIVYGGEMQLYFYSGLHAPTTHLFGPYLVDGTPEQNQRQQAFIRDVEASMPRFFVAVNHPLTWVSKVDPAEQELFRWYDDITQKYKLIGTADIYLNRPTEYTWGADLGNKELQGDFNIFVWQRLD